MRGMTSLEIAIIVAIILVIAIAVGWYLYTTFTSATGGQARLQIVTADLSAGNNNLTLHVVNPGPVSVSIVEVRVAGQSCSLQQSPITLAVGNATDISATCSGTYTPGTMVSGEIVTSAGTVFPFNARVVP